MKEILLVKVGDLEKGIFPKPDDLMRVRIMFQEAFKNAKEGEPYIIASHPAIKLKKIVAMDDVNIIVYSCKEKLMSGKKPRKKVVK